MTMRYATSVASRCAVALLCATSAFAQGNKGEIDPAAASDGLKAIFSYSSGNKGNIRGQFAYITKLYNEEMHVVARTSIRSLADLNGRRVAVDLPNGGTFVTAITIFERLGIKPVYAFIEQRVAYEKLKNGELDAVVAVQGSPSRAVSQVKGENLHFVPIPYSG